MRQRQVVALAIAFLLSTLEAKASGNANELVYIGTFVFGPPPSSELAASRPTTSLGIYGARLNVETGHLSSMGQSIQLQRASWLLAHPTLPILYTVVRQPSSDGASDSAVNSYSVDATSGALRPLNSVDSRGLDATHLVLDSASSTLFVAHHGSGNVTDLPVDPDGKLGAVVSTQQDYGTGPTPRQKSPQAHGVAVDPTHHYVVAADFGADRLFVYGFDGKTRTLSPAEPPFVQLAPGSGPRHLLFNPQGSLLFVNNELTGEVCAYHWDSRAGQLTLSSRQSPYAADYAGQKSAAEIGISPSGQFLYLSLRGDQEGLIAYSINSKSGALTEVQRLPQPGKRPWSFGIDPSGRWMLVAEQGTGSVEVFAIDRASGKLRTTGESISVPDPVALAFVRDNSAH